MPRRRDEFFEGEILHVGVVAAFVGHHDSEWIQASG
jgi:hypothetical protein